MTYATKSKEDATTSNKYTKKDTATSRKKRSAERKKYSLLYNVTP